MVRAAALVTAIWLLTAAASPEERPSFQGYRVGMTLEEVKAVPIPESGSGPTTIRCVGEPRAPSTLRRLPAEEAAGIEVCAPAIDINGRAWAGSLYLADDVQAQSRFSFLHGRLFSISNILPEIHHDAVKAALIARYGEPGLREVNLLQNGLGGQYEQEVLAWSFPAGMIVLTAPEGSRAAMSLYYADSTLAAEATELMRSAASTRLRL